LGIKAIYLPRVSLIYLKVPESNWIPPKERTKKTLNHNSIFTGKSERGLRHFSLNYATSSKSGIIMPNLSMALKPGFFPKLLL